MSYYIRSLGNGRHSVVCPWDEEHTTGSKGDGSTIIFDGSDGKPAAFHCSHSHCSQRTLKDVLKFFNKEHLLAKGDSQKNEIRGFEFKPLESLFLEPEEPIRWIVDKILGAGGISLLAAKPKAGKTTLCTQLALAVSKGEEFLGRGTIKGRVLHLAVEEKKSELIRRYKDQGATGKEDIFVHVAASPKDAIDLLRDIIVQYKPSLLIVDTLFRVVSIENGNDYAEVTSALEPIQRLARELNVHIMLVHHLGKNEREGSDGVLGSSAISASVDNVIILNRNEKYRTIKTDQRYGDCLEETILVFDPITRRTTVGDTKKSDIVSEMSDAICEFLKESKTLMTGEGILNGVRGNRQKVFAALKNLELKGTILKSGKGGRGDPYKYGFNPQSPSVGRDDY